MPKSETGQAALTLSFRIPLATATFSLSNALHLVHGQVGLSARVEPRYRSTEPPLCIRTAHLFRKGLCFFLNRKAEMCDAREGECRPLLVSLFRNEEYEYKIPYRSVSGKGYTLYPASWYWVATGTVAILYAKVLKKPGCLILLHSFRGSRSEIVPSFHAGGSQQNEAHNKTCGGV